MKWADAQKLVERAKAEHEAEITGLRNLYLVVLSIGALVAGLVLLIGPIAILPVFIYFPPEFFGYSIWTGLALVIGDVIGLLSILMKKK